MLSAAQPALQPCPYFFISTLYASLCLGSCKNFFSKKSGKKLGPAFRSAALETLHLQMTFPSWIQVLTKLTNAKRPHHSQRNPLMSGETTQCVGTGEKETGVRYQGKLLSS